MRNVILYRLAIAVPLLIAVSLLTFILVSAIPGDAARTMLGLSATREQYEQLRTELGLDQPLFLQYGAWLVRAAHGDLGNSLVSEQPVLTAILQRAEPTGSLIAATVLMASLVGIALGIGSALRGGRLGRIVDVMSLGGLAVPAFVLGFALVAIFSVYLRWLPPGGYTHLGESPVQWAARLVLPVVSLALGVVGTLAKQVRSSMDDVLRREFMLTLTANGLSKRSIVYRHGLKNASLPIVAAAGVMFTSLLGGTVIVESVFYLPGIGSLAVQAAAQHDLPVVLGVTVVFTLMVIIANLVLDVLYGVLNPKVAPL